jgi:hypothetical protein
MCLKCIAVKKSNNIDHMTNSIKIATLMGRIIFWGGLIACACVALVYLYAARPLADDFERATCQTVAEAISRTSDYYGNWSGRWAGLGMVYLGWSLIPQLSPNISIYYSMLLATVWLLMFAGGVAIMRLLIGGTFFKSLLWTAVVALIYFSFYNDLAPTIYWLPGAAENALGVIIMSLAIWLVMSSIANDTQNGLVYYIGVFLCLLIAPGCHELAGLVACAFFALMLVWCYFRCEHGIPKILLFAFVFAVIGTAINVFSPGNTGREDIAFPDPSIMEMVNTFTIIVLRTLRTIMSPQILLGVPFVAIVIQKHPDILHSLLKYRKWALVIIGAISLAMIGVVLLYSYKLGGHPSARTISFFCNCMFMVILPALIIIVVRYLYEGSIKSFVFVESILYLMLGVSVILGSNIDKGFFSYKKGLLPWIEDQEARHALLLKHSELGSEDVVLKPGPAAPPLLFTYWELGENPKWWQNQDQANYYKVRSIRMKPKE